MNFDKSFWRNVLREADGTPSSARLFCAAIVVSSLAWVTFLVVKNKALPDLVSVGTFDTSTVLAFYGLNKLASTTASIFGKSDSSS